MFSRIFADISSNNATWDPVQYRKYGHILVAIKATEGTGYTNPYHRNWCLHAGLNWISVVHYHFARPDQNSNPADEAAHFLRVAGPLAGWWDYLCVDIERATPQGWTHDPAWTRNFDDYVRANSRFRSIVYANRSTLQISDQWLSSDRRRVWDADWSTSPDYAPAGYECAMRQTSDGVFGPEPHSIQGVGECDVNRMSNGMFQALTQRYRH
jgi:lysozyme